MAELLFAQLALTLQRHRYATDNLAATQREALLDKLLAALAAWEASPDFDVQLLDVEMPGLDGLSLAAELRRRHGTAVPIVLLTGREDDDFLARCHALSAIHFAKPVNWGELVARLRALLA
jgi:DNA-binding response OmpR family regulator